MSAHNPAIIRAKRAGIEVKKVPSAQSFFDSDVMRVIKPNVVKKSSSPDANSKLRDHLTLMPPVEKIEQMASMFRGRVTSFPNNAELPQKQPQVAT